MVKIAREDRIRTSVFLIMEDGSDFTMIILIIIY